MKPPPKLVDSTGRPIRLDRLLASGGEGSVYPLADDATRVAKIYHDPPGERTVEKLAAMAELANPKLLKVCAWPERLVYEARDRTPVGFVMPRLADVQALQHLYNPVQRLKFFPRAGWNFQVRAALNLAAAFDEVHAANCLVGDINQSNVQVSGQALVSIIDCDSFQIHANGKDYLCEVGVSHYTPPELQNHSFRDLVRTPNHDRFGLAVLIFQLLVVGRHPYAGIYRGDDEPSFEEMIADYRFAHGPKAASWNMAPPPHAPDLADVPPDLGKLFRRSFERGSQNDARPTPHEWMDALRRLEANLAECPDDEGHKYWKGAQGCPWCRIAKSGGPEYYYGVAPRAEAFAVDEAKLQDALRRLAAVEPVAYESPRQKFAVTVRPQGQPVRRSVVTYTFVTKLTAVVACLGFVAVLFNRVNALFGYVGFCVAIVGTASWLYRIVHSPWRAERRRRQRARDTASRRLSELEGTYDGIYHRHERQRVGDSNVVKRLLAEWRSLNEAPKLEAQKLAKSAEQRALTRYLQLHPIADATIPSIGQGRKQALAANYILTAADIDADVILKIKGFGPSVLANLIAWRDGVAKTFQFDATTAVTAGEELAITHRLRDREQNIARDVHRRLLDLEHYASECRQQLAALEPELRTAVIEWEQAKADARVMEA